MICKIQKRLLPSAFAFIFLSCVLSNCAHAQTADLSTDEAVIAQLQKRVDAKRAESGTKEAGSYNNKHWVILDQCAHVKS